MSKIIIVFDLGPGDGGKGGVVHKLSSHHQAHTIIKVGGAQGSHGVSTGRQEFAFSQWGCGTFEGVPTYISKRMVVSPEGLLNEADGLRYCGVSNAFDMLAIDERAICSTAYHGIISRIKELARGDNPRGTIGSGVGEAYRDSLSNPELTIYAGDLKGDLRHKLSNIRDFQISKLLNYSYLTGVSGFLDEDYDIVAEEIDLLKDDVFLDFNVSRFLEAGRLSKVVDSGYLYREVLSGDGVAVVESSHGVLTDNVCGFKPHVSAIRTLPIFTEEMLRDAGFCGEIERVGVHRAYTIRHGAGPMPTVNSNMIDKLLPGSHKDDNRYQGKVRVGPLDLVLLKYAVDVAGSVDKLAITWFDQINDIWYVCNNYSNTGSDFFDDNGCIIPFDDTSKLCGALFNCKPTIDKISVPVSREAKYELCDDILSESLGVPVGLVSFGPTVKDVLIGDC